MRHSLSMCIFIFLTAIYCPALGQGMKPGLWEIRNQVTSPDGQMAGQMAQLRKQLAGMTPAQRAQMEQIMRQHGGAGMPTVTDDGMVVRMCVSREMAERKELPVQQTGNCTQRRVEEAGNGARISFTCTNPPASGEGRLQMRGDTAYTMNVDMVSGIGQRKVRTSVSGAGTWLADDCGALAPPAMPAARRK